MNNLSLPSLSGNVHIWCSQQWFVKRSRTGVKHHGKRSAQTFRWQDDIWEHPDILTWSLQLQVIPIFNLSDTISVFLNRFSVVPGGFEFSHSVYVLSENCGLGEQCHWFLQQHNQCTISHPAGVITQISKEIHLLIPQFWQMRKHSWGNGEEKLSSPQKMGTSGKPLYTV